LEHAIFVAAFLAVFSCPLYGMGCSQSGNQAAIGQLLEEYTVGMTLGEGAFGVVYSCTNKKTGEQVAVKMVDKVETPVVLIKREAEMMQRLEHPNIVRCQNVFYERYFVCIVMDRYVQDIVDGLHLYMKEKGKLHGHDIIHIAKQMAASVQHLHKENIVHRDIKGDNYLMDRKNIADKKCHIVLSDFGTACTISPDERLSDEVGTRIFWAPEVYDRSYGQKVDVWALGVTTYGMIEGRFPFRDDNDIKKKELKTMKRVSPVCEDFVRKMLTKDETKRIDANQVAAHPFLTGDQNGAENSTKTTGDEGGADEHEDLRLDAANQDVHERRQELVNRLQAGKKPPPKGKPNFKEGQVHNVTEEHGSRKYEWFPPDKIQALGLLDIKGVPQRSGFVDDSDSGAITSMLLAHKIDISSFGKNGARTLEKFEKEVQDGAVKLMLDATDYKKLVRSVDIVLLRIQKAQGSGKILVETNEQTSNGENRNIHRLPGTKKEPYENRLETAKRILKDLLGMGDLEVKLDFDDVETVENSEESPSYPGVQTVYRRSIIKAYVAAPATDPKLVDVGLPKGTAFSWKNKETTKTFAWMSETSALKKGVKLRAAGSETTSSLALAPIGLSEDDLREYLIKHNVDISKLSSNPNKSLKDLSRETLKGECSLMQNSKGHTVRIVDVVYLKIVDPTDNGILVHTESTQNGQTTQINKLPENKRRKDENHFHTVRRILKRQLKIDDNQVSIDPTTVGYFLDESGTENEGYIGIPTIYRNRIISLQLVKQDASGPKSSPVRT
jgi:serine/threonine protein kinase